jgi:hypothetical protein
MSVQCTSYEVEPDKIGGYVLLLPRTVMRNERIDCEMAVRRI